MIWVTARKAALALVCSVGGPPVKLAVTTPSPAPIPGACSAPLTVTALDAQDHPATLAGLTPVLLGTSSAQARLFADSACSIFSSALTIGPGTRSASFFYSDPKSEWLWITASSPGLDAGLHAESISFPPPAALRFNSFEAAPPDLCIWQALSLVDARGNETLGPINVTLSASDPRISFFAGTTCDGGATSSVTIPPSLAWAPYSFIASTVAVTTRVVFTASGPGVQPGQAIETISGGPRQHLAILSPPQVAPNGSCAGPVQVQLQDASGRAINGSPTPILLVSDFLQDDWFGDPACTQPLQGISVPAGSSTAQYWYRTEANDPSLPDTQTLSAVDFALTAQTQTIAAGAPYGLAFADPAFVALLEGPAGACLGPLRLVLADSSASNLRTDRPVTVTLEAGSPTLGFFADARCSVPTNTVAIGQGLDSAQLWYSDAQPEKVFASAHAASFPLDAVALGVFTSDGGPSGLEWSRADLGCGCGADGAAAGAAALLGVARALRRSRPTRAA